MLRAPQCFGSEVGHLNGYCCPCRYARNQTGFLHEVAACQDHQQTITSMHGQDDVIDLTTLTLLHHAAVGS